MLSTSNLMPDFSLLCVRLCALALDEMTERVIFTVFKKPTWKLQYHSPLGCFQCEQQHDGGPLAASQMHPVPLKIKNGLFTRQLISQSEADV